MLSVCLPSAHGRGTGDSGVNEAANNNRCVPGCTRDLVQPFFCTRGLPTLVRNLNHSLLSNLLSKQDTGSGFLRLAGRHFGTWRWNQVPAHFPAADRIVIAEQGSVQEDPVGRNGRTSHPLHHLLPEQLCADAKPGKLVEHSLLGVREVFGSESRIWSVAPVLGRPVGSLKPRVVHDLAHVQPGT